jgi:hypothetical protein
LVAFASSLNSLPNAPVDLLEFKLRDLIRQRLEEGFGPEFWMAAVPVDIRGVVERKIESHNKSHPYDIEKFSSSATKLSFLDIMDYEKVISSNWVLFASVFQSRGELTKHFLALKIYRNSIGHNRDMNAVEKKNGEAAVLWFEGILTEN